MYSYSKFAKHVFLVGSVNLLGVLQSIVFLPIITKILGVQDYGVWTQLKITLSLLVPFTFLGLNDALIRFLPGAKDREESREGIYSSLVIICGGRFDVCFVFNNILRTSFFFFPIRSNIY